jgi:hypothetical protein
LTCCVESIEELCIVQEVDAGGRTKQCFQCFDCYSLHCTARTGHDNHISNFAYSTFKCESTMRMCAESIGYSVIDYHIGIADETKHIK